MVCRYIMTLSTSHSYRSSSLMFFFVDRYIMILSWYYLRPQSSPNRSCRVETHQTNQQLRHGGDADQGGAAARSPGTAAGPDGRAAVTWWKSRKFMVPLGIARKIPREMDDIIWIYQLDGYIYIYTPRDFPDNYWWYYRLLWIYN